MYMCSFQRPLLAGLSIVLVGDTIGFSRMKYNTRVRIWRSWSQPILELSVLMMYGQRLLYTEIQLNSWGVSVCVV